MPPPTFAQLLSGHLKGGTRPGGHPDRIGRPWTSSEFARAIGGSLTDRTVRNWCAGRTAPSTSALFEIELVLFGTTAAYDTSRAELREAHTLIRSAERFPSRIDTLVLRPCNLPFGTLGSLFKGREGFLARLHAAIAYDGEATPAVAITGRAVHGLGGVGKTRLAVEYAWQHRDAHTATLFVAADTPERLDAGLATLAGPDALALPERAAREDAAKAEAAIAWLARNPGWLLILDNVDDADALAGVTTLLRRLAAHGCRGCVLITGRLSAYPPGIGTLELDVLDPVAATNYLLDATTTRRLPAADDVAYAHELAGALGGLALGLSQAAAYINANRIGLSGYLDLWRRNRAKVLDWFDRDLVSYDHDVGLAATWATSVERLSPEARRLLDWLSFLAPPPIPDSLLDVAQGEGAAGEEAGDLGEVDDVEEYDGTAALRELFAYSLATRSEPRHMEVELGGAVSIPEQPAFAIHRLVQDYGRRGMNPERRLASLATALRYIDKAFTGDATDVQLWHVQYSLIPHAQAVVSYGDEAGISDPTVRLMGKLGLLLRTRARWKEAEPLLRRALAINESRYGPDHHAVAYDLGNLASLLREINRSAEAELLYRRALAISEARYGLDHPIIATRIGNLAGLLRETGRMGEADPMHRRALAINEAHYGLDHPNVAISLNNLAVLLRETGRAEEAEPLLRRALAISEAHYGLDHPSIATRLGNLAGLLRKSGRAEEAEPMNRRALAISEAHYGLNHPIVATRLGNLALLLRGTGREEEAEPLFRRALAIDEASYGPDHPGVAIDLNNLASLLQGTGRAEEAEPMIRRALTISEASYGLNHPIVATCLGNLAGLLHEKGREEEAEPLYRRALAIDEASYGLDHPDVAIDLYNLAGLLEDTGRAEEAEPLIRRARAINEANPSNHSGQ